MSDGRRKQHEVANPAEVAAIHRAVLDDPLTLRDALLDTRPAVEPVPGTAGLLYREQAVEFFSERGHGKSITLEVVLASAAHAGERVLILDRENGAAPVADRFRGIFAAHPEWEHVARDGSLEGRFFPTLDRSWRGTDFAKALTGFTVVAFDSSREFVGQLDGDSNVDADLTRFYNLAVTPLRQRGVAVAITDNIGHRETHRPKGGGAKLDTIPQAYKLAAVEPFNQERLGRIELTCTRSRFGDVDRRWSLRIGDGIFDLPVPASDSPANAILRKREAFRQACVAALAEGEPLARDTLIATARDRAAKGKNEVVREWLSDFASDPASGIVHDDREGYSRGVAPTSGPPRGHPPEPPHGPPLPLKGAGPGAGPGGAAMARPGGENGDLAGDELDRLRDKFPESDIDRAAAT